VTRVFEDLGVPVSQTLDLCETVIVSDGKCAARSYCVDQLTAMWLIGDGVVEFCDAQGAVLRIVNLFEQTTPQRLAA